jgi:hypothetical protein
MTFLDSMTSTRLSASVAKSVSLALPQAARTYDRRGKNILSQFPNYLHTRGRSGGIR